MTDATIKISQELTKATLKEEIHQAQTAGVDITKVIQTSLVESLNTIDQNADSIISDMQATADQFLGEMDNIIDNVFEKLNKDPEKFKILIAALRNARLQSTLESAKVTFDKTLLDSIKLDPIDFDKLQVKLPDGLENKLEDDTPAQFEKLKDYTAIEAAIKTVEPQAPDSTEDFSELQTRLYAVAGKRVLSEKNFRDLEQINKMNRQEYVSDKEEKLFYYGSNGFDKLKCIRYKKGEGRSMSDRTEKCNASSMAESQMLGLDDVSKPIFYQLCLQDFKNIVAQIEAFGAADKIPNADSTIASQIGELSRSLMQAVSENINSPLLAKLDIAISLLNRYSDKSIRYYDTKKREIKYETNHYSLTNKINTIKDKEVFPTSLLRFFEKKHMQELVLANDKVTQDINTFQSNIEQQNLQKNKQDVEDIVNKITNNIKDINNLLNVPPLRLEDLDGSIYQEARQLREDYIRQLKGLMDIWNRLDKDNFHYCLVQGSSVSHKLIQIGGDASGYLKTIGEYNPDAMLFYEKGFFAKAIESINNLNSRIDKTKEEKSDPLTILYSASSDVNSCRSCLNKIRPDSPLQTQVAQLTDTLTSKMKIIADVLSQYEKANDIYSYQPGLSEFKKTPANYIKDKIKNSNPDSDLYKYFLQKYSSQIAGEYMKFQNTLEKANEGENDIRKVSNLLSIKKQSRDFINGQILDLQEHNPTDKNIKTAVDLLASQKEAVIDIIVTVLMDMNKPLEKYTTDDIQEILPEIEQTEEIIRKNKTDAETQYPASIEKLSGLTQVRDNIKKQKSQFNKLDYRRSGLDTKKSRYDEILGEVSKIGDDTNTSQCQIWSATLKEFLRDASQQKDSLQDVLKEITNTHVRSSIETLEKEWEAYIETFTENIKTLNKFLSSRYADTTDKDIIFKPSETIELNEIFADFQSQSQLVEEELRAQIISKKKQNSQKQRDILQGKKTNKITDAYKELTVLCADIPDIKIDDITQITPSTTVQSFEAIIQNIVTQSLIKFDTLKRSDIEALINPFVERQKELIELEIKIPQEELIRPEEITQDMIIQHYLSPGDNKDGIIENSIQKWTAIQSKSIERRSNFGLANIRKWFDLKLKNEELDKKREESYPKFINPFILEAAKGLMDEQLNKRSTENDAKLNKDLSEKRIKNRNIFINKLNTKSLIDYDIFLLKDDANLSMRKGLADDVKQKIEKDQTINSTDLQNILAALTELTIDYSKITEIPAGNPISFKKIFESDHSDTGLLNILELYKNDIPKSKQKEFLETLKILHKREQSGFDLNFVRGATNGHIQTDEPLLNSIPFKKLIENIDISNSLEVKQWKIVIIDRLMSFFDRPTNPKLIRERLGEYLDTIISLPSDAFASGGGNIREIEKYRESMPNYKEIIKPIRDFRATVAKQPERSLQNKVSELANSSQLKNLATDDGIYEENITELSKSKTTFFNMLNSAKEKKDITAVMKFLKDKFPNDALIIKNYDNLASFDSYLRTSISARRDNIIKTLNPDIIFDQALQAKSDAIITNEKTRFQLLSNAKFNIQKDIEDLNLTITNILKSLKDSKIEGTSLFPENLNDYVSDVLQNALTRDAFQEKIQSLVVEYTTLVEKINKELIDPAMAKDLNETLKNIEAFEETVKKLNDSTLNSFKE